MNISFLNNITLEEHILNVIGNVIFPHMFHLLENAAIVVDQIEKEAEDFGIENFEIQNGQFQNEETPFQFYQPQQRNAIPLNEFIDLDHFIHALE